MQADSCKSKFLTSWKNKKNYSHQKIFRQINSLVIYSEKRLLSRNFCQDCVRKNSRNFHTTVWKNEKNSLTKKLFRQINSLVTSLVKTSLSRNFCQKCVRLNHSNFHNVHTMENRKIYSPEKNFVKSTI